MDSLHAEILLMIEAYAREYPPAFPPEGYSGSTHKQYGLSTPTRERLIKAWRDRYPNPGDQDVMHLLDRLYRGESLDEKLLAGGMLGEYNAFRRNLDLGQLGEWLAQLEGWMEVDSTCQSNFSAKEVLARWEVWEPFLRSLVRDTNANKRRAGLVLLVRPVRESDDPRPFRLAMEQVEQVIEERDRRLSKAVSWILREGVKRHRAEIEGFLAAHADQLPKSTVREVRTKLDTGTKKGKPG